MIDEPSDSTGLPPVLTPQLSDDAIEAGDAAAARGDWVLAISVWERLVDSPHHAAASERIRWFVDETAGGDVSRPRFSRGRMMTAGVVLAIIGTACVFLGQSQSGSTRNALSAIAWTFYIVSATLVVAYAFHGGKSPGPTGDVTHTDLTRARAASERLDSNRPGGDREIWPAADVRR